MAFLGLGLMGAPMAGRLLDAGHQLSVWNRSPAKAAPLEEAGARRAGTPREAATGPRRSSPWWPTRPPWRR